RAGEAYTKMGPRLKQRAGDSYQRIARDYPLSKYAAQAKTKLKQMELPIPTADPVAEARMRFEAENKTSPGLFTRVTGFVRSRPDMSPAAKSGAPQMNAPRQNIPVNVPIPGVQGVFQGDITAAPVTDSTPLVANPDARTQPQPANPKP